MAPTGGWQNWTTVSTPLTNAPAGTHELFLVFTHPTDAGGLFNLNWFQVHGKGASTSAPPEVTATATPETGQAPLAVQFNATATDPEGAALTYLWDFGVTGTTTDTSTQEDPTYTYTNARHLHGEGHRDRRVGHQEQRHGRRARHRRAEPVPEQHASRTSSTARRWI